MTYRVAPLLKMENNIFKHVLYFAISIYPDLAGHAVCMLHTLDAGLVQVRAADCLCPMCRAGQSGGPGPLLPLLITQSPRPAIM